MNTTLIENIFWWLDAIKNVTPVCQQWEYISFSSRHRFILRQIAQPILRGTVKHQIPRRFWNGLAHVLIWIVNTLRARRNVHFPDIANEITLTFLPKGRIICIPALVQIIAWLSPGHKPLSEPMIVSLLAHISIYRKYRTLLYLIEIAILLVLPSVWFEI